MTLTTPIALINKVNREMKLTTFSTYPLTGLGAAQLDGLNFVLADIDLRDPTWGMRQDSYDLTTDASETVNEAGFDLSAQNIKLTRITSVRHADDNYPIHQISKEQYDRYALPASNFLQTSLQTGKPRFWFPYEERFYLVDHVPNDAQSITIFFQARLSTAIANTEAGLTSTTAIIYPLSDENMLREGIRWRTRLFLTQNENDPAVLQAKANYEMEILKSSIDDNLGNDAIKMDPFWAATFGANPYSNAADLWQ